MEHEGAGVIDALQALLLRSRVPAVRGPFIADPGSPLGSLAAKKIGTSISWSRDDAPFSDVFSGSKRLVAGDRR